MGALVGQKGTKHQSLGAAESSVTAPKETGRAGTRRTASPGPCRAGAAGTTTSSWAVRTPRVAVNRRSRSLNIHGWGD